jgi:hypothetical protein
LPGAIFHVASDGPKGGRQGWQTTKKGRINLPLNQKVNDKSGWLGFRQEEPGVQYRIRVQRHAFDALLHQPFGQIRVIGWTLPTDADVLAGLFTGLNGIGQQACCRR